jgi:NADH:ubiquinone oxidoreductase subunit 5 (subunit L)/multisubunit Na+/H+ antiporter MnhA subunit
MGYEFMQTARYYLLYSISLVFYCLTVLPRLLSQSRSSSEKSPKNRKKIFIVVAIVAIAIIYASIIIGQFFVQQQQQQHQQNQEAPPNVKFMTFEVDKQEIAVGESTNVLINVRSSEDKVINNAKVVMMIEPSSYEPYLSITNSTIQLPIFLGKDSRTGEVNISITATASPAKEAVYVVKGMVLVNDAQTDIKEFPLTIRQ